MAVSIFIKNNLYNTNCVISLDVIIMLFRCSMYKLMYRLVLYNPVLESTYQKYSCIIIYDVKKGSNSVGIVSFVNNIKCLLDDSVSDIISPIGTLSSLRLDQSAKASPLARSFSLCFQIWVDSFC